MIPVGEAVLQGRELEYVTKCINEGYISSAGNFVSEFEECWAKYCGRRYGVSVSSGTAALQLALACLGLEKDDEVIIPTFTIISCALAVIYNGGIPVLVDVEPDTWCMQIEKVKDKITPRTKAIMPVDVYGHPVDMNPLMELADHYGLAVIEDAAEAHGAEYLSRNNSTTSKWQKCGSFGTVSTFSFYANKTITTGEGGMLLTDDPEVANKARSMRNLCFSKGHRRFYHESLGFNFRLSNIQACIGLAQLERVNEIIERKRWVAQEYTKYLKGVQGLQLPVEKPWAKNVCWMYGILISEQKGIDAMEFAKRLQDKGIETRPFFLGMHEQPAFRSRSLFKDGSYPIAEKLARQGVCLPSSLTLKEEQIKFICDAVKEVIS